MNRTIKDYLAIALKGMGMGAADVVPGVSGGTIAFITGIYEELINSIKSVNLKSIKILLKGDIRQFWIAINGTFLISLLVGIFISVLSLAKLLKFLLEAYPILVWSFFFGLIVASAIYVAKSIKIWNVKTVIATIIGVIVAYLITVISPAEANTSYSFIFMSGAIAICAMILPGISGSFILVLLGMYKFILSSISDMKIAVIAVFMAGAGVGIISFSNILSWLLRKYHDLTIAVLAGFMIGSLNKVWPWKEVTKTFTDRHGELRPLEEISVLPHRFTEVTGADSMLGAAIFMAVVGFVFILLVEKITTKK